MNALHKYFTPLILGIVFSGPVHAERIKDIATIEGVRSNQLVGYGLVVGLDKSGDKTPFTGQSLRSMLARLGMTLPPGIDPKAKNIAAVSIQADLPAFAKPGQTIDVTVSSLGDAKSLRGGTLLMSPLKGADGQVYAIAQGSLVVSGLSASGNDGSSVTVNNPNVGRIPNGAIVERVVNSSFSDGDALIFNLHSPDFTTANRMAESINRVLGVNTAKALDATSVRVNAPVDPTQKVSFASVVENMMVTPDDAAARVIVNSRTGTVVVNGKVRVQPAAVSHGSLTVTITEDLQVSQPNAFSNGQTRVTPKSDVKVEEEKNHMFVFNPGVSLDEIVQAVNNVGAAPSDLVAILEALKSAGSLHAELIVI
ncbi:flagellar basal body P-ring protein FlgI [Methylobacter sp. Wu8]|jgi:flagellar P-ring protein precursor FlgI|uniref:Flagellar P-ring protein n=1 Tax=Methylobacter tundripaludum TaxID=173365 RepID=A0A2S6H328_9GAMM|nr:flagellar basal body P-ring protein FlgI [Methylobacter tundripaludum]MCF7966585.1 flagellar basal body P-ring protein FlgI [Methylobacter tundripaludum]MCK9637471.1 flagellar basal body P-ring protein FlgI [Methylobacter tundripaludum]PPK71830.1 flagellar P-ring protein precursor FlgI [Methylobacter tundripaludum]